MKMLKKYFFIVFITLITLNFSCITYQVRYQIHLAENLIKNSNSTHPQIINLSAAEIKSDYVLDKTICLNNSSHISNMFVFNEFDLGQFNYQDTDYYSCNINCRNKLFIFCKKKKIFFSKNPYNYIYNCNFLCLKHNFEYICLNYGILTHYYELRSMTNFKFHLFSFSVKFYKVPYTHFVYLNANNKIYFPLNHRLCSWNIKTFKLNCISFKERIDYFSQIFIGIPYNHLWIIPITKDKVNKICKFNIKTKNLTCKKLNKPIFNIDRIYPITNSKIIIKSDMSLYIYDFKKNKEKVLNTFGAQKVDSYCYKSHCSYLFMDLNHIIYISSNKIVYDNNYIQFSDLFFGKYIKFSAGSKFLTYNNKQFIVVFLQKCLKGGFIWYMLENIYTQLKYNYSPLQTTNIKNILEKILSWEEPVQNLISFKDYNLILNKMENNILKKNLKSIKIVRELIYYSFLFKNSPYKFKFKIKNKCFTGYYFTLYKVNLVKDIIRKIYLPVIHRGKILYLNYRLHKISNKPVLFVMVISTNKKENAIYTDYFLFNENGELLNFKAEKFNLNNKYDISNLRLIIPNMVEVTYYNNIPVIILNYPNKTKYLDFYFREVKLK